MSRPGNAEPWLRDALAEKRTVMGFDTPTFTPIFVAARITGWTAHITEQLAANSLIRPLSAYVGPGERSLPRQTSGGGGNGGLVRVGGWIPRSSSGGSRR